MAASDVARIEILHSRAYSSSTEGPDWDHCVPMVKTAAENCELHTDEFVKYGKSDVAHKGMLLGMKAVAMIGVRILMDPDFLKKIKDEFKEDTKGL